MWASAPTGVRGGADVHKRRPHAFGPPGVPVGAAFMAARFCPIPQGVGAGTPRQRADVGIRPYGRAPGRAGDHKGRPYVLGPPGVPVGGDALIAPPHRLAAEAGARP